MRPAVLLALVAPLALAGCGKSDRERVEEAMRSRPDATAGQIASVSCSPGEIMWGCRVRLRDGRTQACQVSVDADEEVRGLTCQPLRGE